MTPKNNPKGFQIEFKHLIPSVYILDKKKKSKIKNTTYQLRDNTRCTKVKNVLIFVAICM